MLITRFLLEINIDVDIGSLSLYIKKYVNNKSGIKVNFCVSFAVFYCSQSE